MYEALAAPRRRPLPPPVFYSMAELPRVFAEVASLTAAWWPMLANVPRGDGHAVMVLPGFSFSDASTAILRSYLQHLGYDAQPWQLGTNTGSAGLQERLVKRFLRLAGRQDGAVSLVGQSLGGVFARELARRFPQRVRQVISLGSPFGTMHAGTTNPLVQALFERVSGGSVSDLRAQLLDQDPRQAPPVPTTAIYSKSDGVVAWHTCLERPGPRTENIEIIASHAGMAVNPLVLHAVADRLQHTAATWAPFDRTRGLRAMLYPRPAEAMD